MTLRRQDAVNREGHQDFAVRWTDATGRVGRDLTAVLRVRNEARNLPWVLPPLFECVDEMVIVDNDSDDGTRDIAADLAREHAFEDRLRIVSYPFSVSRCGTEHLGTPPDSVHNLTYFYNWAFSHVRTRYALKWDGDMVLTPHGRQLIRDFAWQSETADLILTIPRHSVYLVDGSEAWVDVGMRNVERWAWPNKPEYYFTKGLDWEMPTSPTNVHRVTLPKGCCFEIKWLDLDEFDHWSEDIDFIGRTRQTRKAREMKLFDALRTDGRGQTADNVVRVIPAPGQDHVLEHVSALTPGEWKLLAG